VVYKVISSLVEILVIFYKFVMSNGYYLNQLF